VESPQTAHFVMEVTKDVNFAQGKPLADKNAERTLKTIGYASLPPQKGGV
jgi:hypothetical protein